MSHGGSVALPREGVVLPAGHPWTRLPAIGVGMIVAGLAVAGALGFGERFYFSWLFAFMSVLGIALGCLYFVLFHHATQAGWGVVVRRLAEAGAATLPLFAILFVPVALGLHTLYPWSHAGHQGTSDLLWFKNLYLEPRFFYARAAVYFLVWGGISQVLLSLSRRQDEHPDPALAARLRTLSAPVLIPLAITHHLAAVDWLMSLDPHWYSTIFGVYVFSGALVAGFSFLALVPVGLQRAGLLRDVVTAEHFHDLGKLLFAFTVFWAYIGFSQFFLIWYGNLPEETVWYRHRMDAAWLPVSIFLIVGHFAVPFFFLMSRGTKRRPGTLAAGAIWMLAMHLVDIYWVVMPNAGPGSAPSPLDAAALLVVGGAFVAGFGWRLRSQALVPMGDPRLPESLGFENV